MEDRTAFYMIFVEGGNAPMLKHESFELAETEAKRLAHKTGKEAFVLKVATSYKTKSSFDVTQFA